MTGDRDLLKLLHYHTIAIVNPGQFLLALELSPMDAEALSDRFNHQIFSEIAKAIPLEPEMSDRVREALCLLEE